MSYGMCLKYSISIWCTDCRSWAAEYVAYTEEVARDQAGDGYRNHKKTCSASEATL